MIRKIFPKYMDPVTATGCKKINLATFSKMEVLL